MDDELIKRICEDNFKKTDFESLSKPVADIFIKSCYTCLFNKCGNQDLARKILNYAGEIHSYTYDNQPYTIYLKDIPTLSTYDSLIRSGVTTVKVFDETDIPRIQEDFKNVLRQFPEYKRNVNNPNLNSVGNTLVYVLGGFAALGNPSSFHNEFVRNLRIRTRRAVTPLFRSIIKNNPNIPVRDETGLEMLIDRMMYRLESQAPSAESWHRDVAPSDKIETHDEIYGGWLNLDTKSQFLSCIPGSHLGISLKKLKKGFASVPKEHIGQVDKYKIRYEIPPGHIVIFPQYIIHEVISKKALYDMMRLFIGWRTTVSKTFLYRDMRERFENQAIIPLPSGQLPPMYSANHATIFKDKEFKPIPKEDTKVSVRTWSESTINDVFVGKDNITKRFMDDLKKSGMKMYTPYSSGEINEYLPNKI